MQKEKIVSMNIRGFAVYLGFVSIVTVLSAQAPRISPEEIEKMVDDIVAEAQDEEARKAASPAEGSQEYPTKVCRDSFREKTSQCADDAACKTLANDQLRLCIAEALRTASQEDPRAVLERAEAALSQAQTFDECEQALLIRQSCGASKDCRDKILEGFNQCGKRVSVLKAESDGGVVKRSESAAKQMALLTTEDLRKIKLQQEIEHLKARNMALRKELERSQTTIKLLEEGYKSRQLSKIRKRDEARVSQAKKEALQKDIIAQAQQLSQEIKAYQMSAKAIQDHKKLAEVAGFLLKVRDAEERMKKLYASWLASHKETIEPAETFLKDVVAVQKDLSAHIGQLEGNKKAETIKSKAEKDLLLVVNSYLSSMRSIRDRALKTTRFSEAERSLSELEPMLEKTKKAYAQFESQYKSKVAEVDTKIADMNAMIASVRDVRDRLVAQKPA